MARRRSSLGWQLDAKDPLAVPNARIALALLRCVRRLPGVLDEHMHNDFGSAIAPAVHPHARELKQALLRYQASRPEGIDRLCSIDLDTPEPLLDRDVLLALGLGASKQVPHFRLLFDKVEAVLQGFVERHPHPSDGNIRLLAEMLSLPAPEQAFLRLAAAFCYGTIERSMFNFVDSAARLQRVLGALCGATGSTGLRMFDASSPLASSGLLAFSRATRGAHGLDDLLILNPVGERLLSSTIRDPQAMSEAVLEPLSASSSATALQWPHLANNQALLGAALRGALAQQAKGFNVLVHGAPGTGKTEFVRQLLADIGAAGFQVSHMDERGEEASRTGRLSSLRLSQTFAGRHQRAVLVLDEAEDIFTNDYQSPLSRVFRKDSESKAWMNSLLEGNAHPVLWICNQVQHLDPAYLRRFSLCIEFPRAPFTQRLRIAQEQLLPVGCSAAAVEQIAASEAVTPALVASAAQLARLSAGGSVHPDLAVRLMVEGHCQATGQAMPREFAASATRFDTRYLNLSGGMTPGQIVEAMETEGCANVLFHGEPGTGKTQFAAEIAKQLGRRLVVRTASDLNSMWYGQSEANVARMFKECDTKNELLFLDEADVLLGAREQAGQHVDRAVTAEFLRWLESFGGLFVCATNHAVALDRALMRRFVFRVGFEPLTAGQRAELLAELALDWHPGADTLAPAFPPTAVARLQRLDQLTAGDFANVARRLKRVGSDLDAWLAELQSEQAAKTPSPARPIGFF